MHLRRTCSCWYHLGGVVVFAVAPLACTTMYPSCHPCGRVASGAYSIYHWQGTKRTSCIGINPCPCGRFSREHTLDVWCFEARGCQVSSSAVCQTGAILHFLLGFDSGFSLLRTRAKEKAYGSLNWSHWSHGRSDHTKQAYKNPLCSVFSTQSFFDSPLK